MAAAGLVQAFQGLTVGCAHRRQAAMPARLRASAATLSSRVNGIVAATRLQASPVQRVVAAEVAPLEVDAKLKTHKAAAKRFKVTGSGKVRCRHPCKQHLNEKMSRNTKRRLSKGFAVDDRDLVHVKGQLPYSSLRKSGTGKKK